MKNQNIRKLGKSLPEVLSKQTDPLRALILDAQQKVKSLRFAPGVYKMAEELGYLSAQLEQMASLSFSSNALSETIVRCQKESMNLLQQFDQHIHFKSVYRIGKDAEIEELINQLHQSLLNLDQGLQYFSFVEINEFEKKQKVVMLVQLETAFRPILNKARLLKNQALTDINYSLANIAADKFIETIQMAKINFLQSGHDNNPLQQFKKDCLNAINQARVVLNEHRGWAQVLASFASFIVSLCSLGTINFFTGKGAYSLFAVKTDSAERLDAFEAQVCNMSEQILFNQ